MAQLPDSEELSRIVIAAAQDELLPRFAQTAYRDKLDGSLVSEADTAMQTHLQQALAATWPGYAFLGEEMTAGQQRQLLSAAGEGLWCLDPLDGTSNFITGLPFFAVSLALLQRGQPVLGLVYDPVRGECFTAERAKGAWLNGSRLKLQPPATTLSASIAVVDFKRLPAALGARLGQAPPYRSQRNFGSTALEWCWLAAGRYQLYVHGRQKLWDYAAGYLILSEAGGQAVSLSGEPLITPELGDRSVMAAQGARLLADWRAWLGG